MLCESCRERPATYHLKQTVNRQRVERHLCAHCASHLQGKDDFFSAFGGFGLDNLIENLFGGRPHSPMSLMDQLSEDAERVLERAAELAAERGYPRLGTELVLLALAQDAIVEPLLRRLGIPVETLIERLELVCPAKTDAGLEEVTLTSRLKRAIQLAHEQAMRQGARYLGPEHLLLGILAEGESLAAQILGELTAPEALQERLSPVATAPETSEPLGQALTKYARDLSALAKQGKIDPVIGRDQEIERVIRILSRRTKNNPVLIGEPGVGKTAIAEGLAQRIVSGEVPEVLKGKRVLSLDLGALVAGTKYRGEFEERLKSLMDEIRKQQGKVVLLIDELHTVVGAGAAEGSMDASNMLKPALARGELQTIGATTLDEYRKHIEKDAALERRFQPVLVEEPTPEQAIEILRGIRDLYEAHHRVKIEDDALVAAVELSDKYVTDRYLPDKAIDLIDEAAAMQRLGGKPPEELDALEDRVGRLERDKAAAIATERYEEAARLNDELKKAQERLTELKKGWKVTKGAQEPVITADDVARVVSEWTGVPADKLVAEEKQRLLEIEEHLHRRVIGQEEAIEAVAEAVRRSRTGMKDPNRPIGSFLFLGPTGVGKTELAKALAEFLFGDEDAMVRFDMSEYQEKHTISRLVGAPPGYVGYEEAGQLTEAVRRRPYRVVLFDEIEKAHPDVFNTLLQILDDGRITDAKGKTVNFKNTVVIMTSNVGAHRIYDLEERGASWDEIKEAATEVLKVEFRPEFLNRIDEITVFHPLSKQQILQIVDLMLEGTRRKVKAQGLELQMSDSAKEALSERGFDPAYGARPLRRAIQREIENRISRLLLQEEFQPGDRIRVDYADGRFTLFREERPAVKKAE